MENKTIKIFISCSGNLSKEVASILHNDLPIMLNYDVFVSDHDLNSGHRWVNQLTDELLNCDFGIICLTPENLNQPWIMFEAGSMAKSIEGRVCGLIIGDLKKSDIIGPLSPFQHRKFNKKDMHHLIRDLNKLNNKYPEKKLDDSFNKFWWPRLEKEYENALSNVNTSLNNTIRRSQEDILEEILDKIRVFEQNFEMPLLEHIANRNSLIGKWVYILGNNIYHMNIFGTIEFQHPVHWGSYSSLNLMTAKGNSWYFGNTPTKTNKRGEWNSLDIINDHVNSRLIIIYEMKIEIQTYKEKDSNTKHYRGMMDLNVRKINNDEPNILVGSFYDLGATDRKLGEVTAIKLGDIDDMKEDHLYNVFLKYGIDIKSKEIPESHSIYNKFMQDLKETDSLN